jgi:hypothetical protein
MHRPPVLGTRKGSLLQVDAIRRSIQLGRVQRAATLRFTQVHCRGGILAARESASYAVL